MQFWAIIKLIAGIIANLPFSKEATEEEVSASVNTALECVQEEPDVVSLASVPSIPKSDWEELAPILTALLLWVLKRFGK